MLGRLDKTATLLLSWVGSEQAHFVAPCQTVVRWHLEGTYYLRLSHPRGLIRRKKKSHARESQGQTATDPGEKIAAVMEKTWLGANTLKSLGSWVLSLGSQGMVSGIPASVARGLLCHLKLTTMSDSPKPEVSRRPNVLWCQPEPWSSLLLQWRTLKCQHGVWVLWFYPLTWVFDANDDTKS